MLKKKTSKKHGFSLDAMPTLKPKKKAKLQKHQPALFFKDFDKVGAALLESLIENDTDAFIEILDAYLKVNRARVAKRAKMSRSVFSKRKNIGFHKE